MKRVFSFLITIYQVFLSPFLKVILGASSQCLYKPTCSQYTKQMIIKKGVFKGSLLGVKRIASCR